MNLHNIIIHKKLANKFVKTSSFNLLLLIEKYFVLFNIRSYREPFLRIKFLGPRLVNDN